MMVADSRNTLYCYLYTMHSRKTLYCYLYTFHFFPTRANGMEVKSFSDLESTRLYYRHLLSDFIAFLVDFFRIFYWVFQHAYVEAKVITLQMVFIQTRSYMATLEINARGARPQDRTQALYIQSAVLSSTQRGSHLRQHLQKAEV